MLGSNGRDGYSILGGAPAADPVVRQRNAIEVYGLTRRFGNFTAVDHVSFQVPAGSAFGLLGLNGAGKTTSIKMLTTVLRPTTGTAMVAGHDVLDEAIEVRRRIGYVGHDTTVLRPDWRPWEYLTFFGRLQGMRKRDVERVAQPLMDHLVKANFHNRPLNTFSSGMKKRVEIIRALLHRPRVLFLDEPTKDLDILAKEEMWESLRDLVRGRDLTVLVASHDAQEIEALCDHLAVIASGRLAFNGTPQDLPRGESFQKRLVRLLREGGITT